MILWFQELVNEKHNILNEDELDKLSLNMNGENVKLEDLGLTFQYSPSSRYGVVKFVLFEKATKFDEISILLLTNKFVFPVQFWTTVWFLVLELYSLRSAKSLQILSFLDTDKFVLSFLLISNKSQLCRI